jgi:hypothetical protein
MLKKLKNYLKSFLQSPEKNKRYVLHVFFNETRTYSSFYYDFIEDAIAKKDEIWITQNLTCVVMDQNKKSFVKWDLQKDSIKK